MGAWGDSTLLPGRAGGGLQAWHVFDAYCSPDPAFAMGGLKMKSVFFLLFIAFGMVCAHAADDRIYRCGNEYTNTVSEDQAKTCKLISGSNVTVIQAVKPAPARVTASGQRVDSVDQRAKDSDARMILEAELKRAESKNMELLKEYNNGEPEKLGPETRNHQKYLERITELKNAIARNESDIAGIKRELARVAPSAPSSAVSNASGSTLK
jgi:hypothetical protein